MNLIFFTTSFVFLSALSYIAMRAISAVKRSHVSGFLLNPLFYLVFFSLFYLLAGSLFVINDAQAVFDLGRYKSGLESAHVSTIHSLTFFLVIFAFYVASPDKKIGNVLIQFGATNTAILFFLGSGLVLYFSSIFYLHFSDIISLREDRTTAFSYYVVHVWQGLRYSFFLNLSLVFVFLVFLLQRPQFLLIIFATVVAIFVLALDYSHGGRSASIKLLLSLYLAVAIRNNQFYFFRILSALFLLGLLGVLQRSGESALGLRSLYFLFSEFILTRYVTDIVIYHQMSGDAVLPFLAFFGSFFPSSVKTYFGIELVSIGGLVQAETGLSFGLASNLVAEAIYYYGNWSFLSAIFVSAFFLVINRIPINGVPSLLLLMLYIVNIQNMIRTSFYDLGLAVFYVLFVHFFIILVFLWGKRLYGRVDN